MFHERILTASPRVCAREKFFDLGIDFDSTYLHHSITCSLSMIKIMISYKVL
jgi:hypothetical protein